MPTENRSSNTEIVSVPRGLIEKLEQFGEGSTPARTVRRDVLEQVYALLVQPAPQRHPEPMAWMVGTAIWWTKAEAERDSAEVGLPVIALGPIADPGEIERLRAALDECRKAYSELEAQVAEDFKHIDGLRAQLAERDALLREFLEVATGGFSDSDHVLRVRRHLETFLSASAEQKVKS